MKQSNDGYCTICSGCSEEECCSPLMCVQHKDGEYCEKYLKDLKFGYKMNSFFQEKIWDRMSEELKKEYDEMWDEMYSKFYDHVGSQI